MKTEGENSQIRQAIYKKIIKRVRKMNVVFVIYAKISLAKHNLILCIFHYSTLSWVITEIFIVFEGDTVYTTVSIYSSTYKNKFTRNKYKLDKLTFLKPSNLLEI